MDSLCIFHRLLLRPRLAVLRDHLPSRFLRGSPCKLLRCCVWALGTLGLFYSARQRRQARRRGNMPQIPAFSSGNAGTLRAYAGRRRWDASCAKPERARNVVRSTLPARLLVRAELTQLAECQLPKLDVAGSNPVLRSIFPSPAPAVSRRHSSRASRFAACILLAGYPHEYDRGVTGAAGDPKEGTWRPMWEPPTPRARGGR